MAGEHLGLTSDLTRGCGGVAILWRKTQKFFPITAIVNDRICGVRLFLPQEQRCMTILGLYMPSSEHPQESYLCYLQSVEHIIAQFDADGPLLLLGDLNAHLG